MDDRTRLELAELEHKLGWVGIWGAKHPYNVTELIETWGRFGPTYGADDRSLIQDYVHFLQVRDTLAKFVTAATPGTRAYLEALIGAADASFRAATIPTDDQSLVSSYRGSGGWWWHRAPKVQGREIRKFFDTAGE